MVPIHTKPPSREYDEGWDAIFGKKKEPEHVHELGSCTHCDTATDRDAQRDALRELTRLTEEMGGYDTSEPDATPSDPEK